MSGSVLMARKDLTILFRSPLAYVILFCFLLVSGYFFWAAVSYYELISIQLMQNPQEAGLSPAEMVVGPYLQNSGVVLLFFLPLLTMRGFAEEKKSGTLEMLLSYPLREHELVGGKLLALTLFLVAALGLHAVGPFFLLAFTSPDILPAACGYLGLLLLVVSFASLGLFFSSLTENQIVAAVLTFASLLLLWVLSWVQETVSPGMAAVLNGLSPLQRFDRFTKGVLDVADLVYFITFIAGFFWLSVLSLENQRWRK